MSRNYWLIKALLLLIVGLFMHTGDLFAQYSPDSLLNAQMHKALNQMEQKQWLKADATFRKMVNTKKSLPDDFNYYYGKTLYEMRNLGKSRSYLEKYISIKSTNGKYYSEATALLAAMDPKVCKYCGGTGNKKIETTCPTCSGKGQVVESCPFCQRTGHTICPVCGGDGVKKQSSKIGMNFSPCEMCEGHGYLNCKACKGSKVFVKDCEKCNKTGKIIKEVPCNHQ